MAKIPLGTLGTPSEGVTGLDGADEALVPLLLVAVTLNVYAVPLVKFVMVQVVAGAVAEHAEPPGLAIAV